MSDILEFTSLARPGATAVIGQLADEFARQATLRRYEVLDTAAEPSFDKITQLVRTILDVPMAAVSLIDAERQWFKSRQGLAVSETPRAHSFCRYTIQRYKPLIVEDASADLRFAGSPLVLEQPYILAYAGVPLSSPDGYNVGSLCALDTKPRRFSDAQIAILQSLAALVVDELDLRLLASRDGLTGALTRRAFIAECDKAQTWLARHDERSVLLLMDVDHFKRLNDTYGHGVGDEALKVVAAACQEVCRPQDVFGRLGGEEFGILLATTDLPTALEVAERFRIAVAQSRTAGRPRLQITASFGVAPLSTEIQTTAQWLARADDAVYKAKAAGRNRCVVAAQTE